MSNETAGTTENTNNGGQTSNNNNRAATLRLLRRHLLRRRSPPRLLRLRRLLLRASPSTAVLLSRVHTVSLVALIPGAELARTASTALVFVSYCLTGRYCRPGTTGTFMGWTRVSDPQPGDVVVNSYHTGIYIGGGQMIHASDYNTGVIISSVAAGMNNNYIFVRY